MSTTKKDCSSRETGKKTMENLHVMIAAESRQIIIIVIIMGRPHNYLEKSCSRERDYYYYYWEYNHIRIAKGCREIEYYYYCHIAKI